MIIVQSVLPVHIKHPIHRVRPSHVVNKVPPPKVDGDLVVGGCFLEHPEGDGHLCVLDASQLTNVLRLCSGLWHVVVGLP